MRTVARLSIGLMLASSLFPSAVSAQTAPGLGDLIGIRGSSADGELGRRGYRQSGTNGGASMWWNSSSKRCVSLYIDDGRVQSLQSASARDCGQSGGNGAAAAVAGVAAIGLIAALTSHKKKGNDYHSSAQHDDEYSRGYNDGIYSGQYDRNDTEAYHEGYMAGQAERQNRAAANSRFVRGAPSSAQRACMERGDSYLNVPPGSTVPVGVYSYGQGSFEITVASGHYRARCTVDNRGYVSDISPY